MYLLWAFAIVAVIFGASASRAEDSEGVANYAYSVFVGTGKYSIEDRVIYVIRAPLAFDLDNFDLQPDRSIGARLLLPVAVGLTYFENLDEFPGLDIDALQTLSIVPGVELPITLNKHWQVIPFLQAGYGIDTRSDSRSFIWGVGSRLHAEYGEQSRWTIGGEFLWAGNDPNKDDPTTRFSRWGMGLEYKIPTNLVVAGRYISWHIRAIQWYFTDAVDFEEPLLASSINRTTELGLSFGLSRPVPILGYNFSQLGVGYEWANDLSAIKFFTTFPF